VRLPQTGSIVLSGDVTHFRDNWEQRRVPSINTSAEQTQASMQRVAQVLADKHAELWINHDDPQSLSQKHSPAFYD
jgi:N-acyl homoserine lactone hydrolase